LSFFYLLKVNQSLILMRGIIAKERGTYWKVSENKIAYRKHLKIEKAKSPSKVVAYLFTALNYLDVCFGGQYFCLF
jgi:hypothetical protein